MVKTVLKWLGRLAAVALLAGAAFLVNLIWFRPFSLNLFYEKTFITFALQNPELLTSIGVAEQFGYRKHNAHLDDVSIAKVERDYATWHGYLRDLKAYDVASQTDAQRLSTRILTWFIESELEGEKFRFHNYPVNQLFGVQSETPEFLSNQHRIADRRGAEDYLARLGEVGRKFDQVLEGLALRERNGVMPPRFVIERVLDQMRAFSEQPANMNPLYLNFVKKVAALADVTPADRQALAARCLEAIERGVIPAYRRMIAFHEGQLSRSSTDDGVWKLPDGDAYYAYRLGHETSTRMTPQRVHDLGLSEVARAEQEMTALLQSRGELRPAETPGPGGGATREGPAIPLSGHRGRTQGRAHRLHHDDRGATCSLHRSDRTQPEGEDRGPACA